MDGDGHEELIAGSRDFEIQVLRNEEIIATISEADAVTNLTALTGSDFGYSLANGTVGVYDRGARKWRVKSKHMPTSLASYDLDGDGIPELVAGWDNGRVEVCSISFCCWLATSKGKRERGRNLCLQSMLVNHEN